MKKGRERENSRYGIEVYPPIYLLFLCVCVSDELTCIFIFLHDVACHRQSLVRYLFAFVNRYRLADLICFVSY